MNEWYKVFLPLSNYAETRWIGITKMIQAESIDEAIKIAERVFIPRGYDLDDSPTASIASKEESEYYLCNGKMKD